MNVLVVLFAVVAVSLATPGVYVAPTDNNHDAINVAYQNAYARAQGSYAALEGAAYARNPSVYPSPYVYYPQHPAYAPYPAYAPVHSDHPVDTLSPGGPAGIVLNADGTPVETYAVQAAKAADAIAHLRTRF